MPDTKTIVKSLASFTVVPGLFYTAMGLGVAPIIEEIEAVAKHFIGPIGLDTKPFFLILGPCKIMAGLSFWGIGPMPEWFGRIGLLIASTCGAIGHGLNGESMAPPLIYASIVASLYVLDKSGSKGKQA